MEPVGLLRRWPYAKARNLIHTHHDCSEPPRRDHQPHEWLRAGPFCRYAFRAHRGGAEMIRRSFLFLSLAAAPLLAQAVDPPFPAHRVIGNVYYVGSTQLASFLITTPQGHILINSSYERTVPLIEASVEKLGFHFRDINILLDSHAHGDHVAGNPLVKKLTGATVMVMQEDAGEVPGSIDRILHNGDQVKLGGVVLTAHLTPGHTKGATTWTLKTTEGGKSYNVVISSSIGVNPGY